MEYIEPSNDYQNYIWDTQSLNELATDAEMVALCKRAFDAGQRYFITTVQERELVGVPDRTMKYSDDGAWGEYQERTLLLMEELNFCRCSCVALFYQNFWLLDGSMRILPDSGPRTDLFNDIYNNNNHHKRDATIGEAAVYHGCTLITNDKRLRNKVNKYFPGTAISYDEYKNTLERLFSAEVSENAD